MKQQRDTVHLEVPLSCSAFVLWQSQGRFPIRITLGKIVFLYYSCYHYQNCFVQNAQFLYVQLVITNSFLGAI